MYLPFQSENRITSEPHTRTDPFEHCVTYSDYTVTPLTSTYLGKLMKNDYIKLGRC